MRTPRLIDVPQGVSRRDKLKAFKQIHQIETHYAGKSWGRKNHPWSALHMPSAWKCGYVDEKDNMFECVAKACRILEEGEVLVEGETEREAVRTLCGNLGIAFTL